MININVKRKQNGEIISESKKVVGIYSIFMRYKQTDYSESNFNLQQRLKPLNIIEYDSEFITGDFKDSLENIRLQKYLYHDEKAISSLNTNAKINKVKEVWAFIGDKLRNIFSLALSCFSPGTWLSAEKWSNTEHWKH